MDATDTPFEGKQAPDGEHVRGDSGESVLVLANAMDGDEDYCGERVSSPHGTVSPNALLVSLDDRPERRFEVVVRRGVGQPANVAIVSCDETRSATVTQSSLDPGSGSGLWIATVSSPGDLTGLGVRIEQALSAWADHAEPIELCIHSLTTLLQYSDEQAVFRFCHALSCHLDAIGANSHFHLDPAVVDERTVITFSGLFDSVEDRT